MAGPNHHNKVEITSATGLFSHISKEFGKQMESAQIAEDAWQWHRLGVIYEVPMLSAHTIKARAL